MKTSLFAAVLPGLLVVAGCRALPEPVCQSILLVPVKSATGPRRAAVNQQVTYNLTYITGSSCGTFAKLVSNVTDSLLVTGASTRQVAVQGQFTGCSCVTDTTTRFQTTYQFQPTKAGTYYVQFLTSKSQFITDTLTVR